MRNLPKPINCATAEGDIRLLMQDKARMQDRKERRHIKAEIGDYNKKIDAKIAAIKEECGLD